MFRLPLYYFSNIAGSSSDDDVTKMEGCPRSLMLNVDLKETFPTEFTPSLKTVKKDKRINFIYSQILWPEYSKCGLIFSISESTTTRMPTRTRTNALSWNNFER